MPDTHIRSHDAGRPTGTMSCPNCAGSIGVTFDALLITGRLVCPNRDCNTTLTVNQAHSTDAMSALRALRDRLRELGPR